jgi:hypothetical protein
MLQYGPNTLNVSNTGIYPTMTTPGCSGAGGQGGSSNTDANNGGAGKHGYARIYFLDN